MRKATIILLLISLSLTFIFCVFSQTFPQGLPDDIKDFNRWTRLNKKIIKPRIGDPHRGYKRVYINRLKTELIDSGNMLVFPYPEGTIVVKEVRETANIKSKVRLIAIMRKVSGNETTGGWDFIEYSRQGDNSFTPINFPKESCYSCHQGASDSDSVWVKFDRF